MKDPAEVLPDDARRPMTQPDGTSGPKPGDKDPPNPKKFRSPLGEVRVSMGGPRERPQQRPPLHGGAGWSAGDIDFKEDGTIFIRNPYLADAIEKFLQENWEKMGKPRNEQTEVLVQHFLRIVRDEGWSGHPTNVVC